MATAYHDCAFLMLCAFLHLILLLVLLGRDLPRCVYTVHSQLNNQCYCHIYIAVQGCSHVDHLVVALCS